MDGSHEPPQIMKDADSAFNILNLQGILWFDDYLGGPVNDRVIKNTIDYWVASKHTSIVIIHKGYQLGCLKVAN